MITLKEKQILDKKYFQKESGAAIDWEKRLPGSTKKIEVSKKTLILRFKKGK